MKKRVVKILIVAIFVTINAVGLWAFHGRFIKVPVAFASGWQLGPNNDATHPLTSRIVNITIANPTSGAAYYRLVKNDSSKLGASGKFFGLKSDGDALKGTVNLLGMDKIKDHKELLLVAKDNSDNTIFTYPDIITIYVDYRFESLSFDLTANLLPSGDFTIMANPSVASASLANEPQNAVKLYSWKFYEPIFDKLTGALTSWHLLSTSTTDVASLLVARSAPGTMYVAVSAKSGATYDTAGYYDGLSTVASTDIDTTAHINKIVVKTKPESGDGTAITPGFSTNTVTSDKIIPANHKFALTKNQITLFSGGMLALPINPGASQTEIINPKYIEIELPSGISLEQPSTTSFKNKFSIVTSPEIASGYHRYRLEKDGGANWGLNNAYVNIYPTFADNMAGATSLIMKIRLYNAGEEGRVDLWQTLPITLEVPPDLQLPKRLTTSFSYASTTGGLLLNKGADGNIDQFLNLYKKLGFNTVPNRLTTENLNTTNLLFTPAQRATKAWEGLRYGPTFSAFYNNYVTSSNQYKKSIFHALFFDQISSFFKITKTVDGKDTLVAPTGAEFLASYDTLVNKNTFNAAFGTHFLSDDDFAPEKTKFYNAIKYNIDSKGGLDMAYDGILLTANLDDIEKITATSKPEYLYLDAEDFTTYEGWRKNVSQSLNAQQRKNSGESDIDEADRMLSEFWDKFDQAVHKYSPDTKVVYYSSNAYNNKGMEVTPWNILQDHNLIQQTDTYIPGRNLGEFINLIRANKLALPEHYDNMPILTTGTYNEIDPQMIFDQAIHTFLNGATGISYFGESSIDDMADILNISKAIKLVSPFEDLVMDGDVAYNDIHDSNNAIISAMRQNSGYLIGVTPQDKTKNVSFFVQTNNNMPYKLVNQKTGLSVDVHGPDIEIPAMIMDSTTVYSLMPTTGTLELKADREYVITGSEVNYTVKYKNTSPSNLTNVTFSVPVDDFAQIDAASITNGGSLLNGKINWTLSNPLAPNQEFIANFKIRVH